MTARAPHSTIAPPPFELILPGRGSRIGHLVFHGVGGRPVIDPDALGSLRKELRKAARADLRALVVRSAFASKRIFAGGADLRLILKATPADAEKLALAGQQAFAALRRAPMLTIAVVEGAAIGGGLDLILACDIRIATPEAKFGHPGVRLGIVTSWGGTVRLPDLVGLAEAERIFYTGDPLDARRAHEIGLVDLVGRPAELRHTVTRLAALRTPTVTTRARLRGATPLARRARLGLVRRATAAVPLQKTSVRKRNP